MIFIHHFGFQSYVANSFGDLAVCLFFTLSGFVLCAAHERKWRQESTLPSVGRFMIHRFARIYPLYLLGMLVMFVLQRFHIPPPIIAADILMLQSWVPKAVYFFSGNAPTWFVSALMPMYLLFIPLMLTSLKHPRRFGVICAVYFAVYLSVVCMVPENMVKGIVYINPLMQLSAFLLGMLLWKVYGKVQVRHPSWLMALAWLFMIAAVALYTYLPERFSFGCWWWIPVSLLILTTAMADRDSNIIMRFMKCRPMMLLAEYSFAFYIIHYPCLRLLHIFYAKTGLSLSLGLQFATALVLVTILAAAADRWIGVPAARFIKSRFQIKNIQRR